MPFGRACCSASPTTFSPSTRPRSALRKKKSKKHKKEKKEKKSKEEKHDAGSKESQAAAEFIEEEVVDAKSYEEIQSSVCPSLTAAHTNALAVWLLNF